MIKRIVPALFATVLVQSISAHAAQLTDEQRAAIAERISPVGDVCLQGENCGGLPDPETSAKPASMVASSGSGEASGSSATGSSQGSSAAGSSQGGGGSDDADGGSAGESVASSDASGAAGPGEGASNVAVAAADDGSASSIDGEAIYNQACMACHASGVGGAPKVGDVEAWSPRIAKGMDALHQSGLQGVAGTAMMAKGGRMDLSDQEVMAAVDYMVESSQ